MIAVVSPWELVILTVVMLAVLGILVPLLRRTRVLGILLSIFLAAVVAGLVVVFYLQVPQRRPPDRGHRDTATAVDASSHDSILVSDLSMAEMAVEETSPVEINLDDAAETTDVDVEKSPPVESLSPDETSVAEVEEFTDESEWVTSGAGTDDAISVHTMEVMMPGRPSWVLEPPSDDKLVDYVTVTSGPWVTRGECRRALNEAIEAAVAEYIADHHGEPSAARYVGIDMDYIKENLQAEPVYEEMVKYESIEHPMRQQHVLLSFGKDFRELVERRWNQVVVTSRLAHVALVLMAVLIGLGTIFTYFRVDTATKGYYSGRLQLAAGMVILGLVGMGILIARWVPWL